MKRYFFSLIIAVITLNLLAEKHLEQNKNISEDKTLKEISFITEIPVSKLIEYTGLSRDTDRDATLRTLKLKNSDIQSAITKYNQNKTFFFSGIIIVGMLVVFSSLLIVGLVIIQLKKIVNLFERKKKTVENKSVNETKRVSTGSLGEEVITAVFTAIYLYEAEIEERRRQNSFFKTFTTNWRALNHLNMPNVAHKNCKL
ncbi:MAG: OadG family protein [Candidatus Cloacimonetes bacterium]|nr:OadG family protein [Candidatus Cloacimonadota bacterium]